MTDNETFWNIKVNKKQADIINKALEIYNRLLMGQIDVVLEVFINQLSYDDRQTIHRFARQFIYKELGHSSSSYSIRSKEICETARVAYDIEQVIRQVLSWHKKGKEVGKDQSDSSMIGVSFYDPLRTSDEPLPKMAKVEDNV